MSAVEDTMHPPHVSSARPASDELRRKTPTIPTCFKELSIFEGDALEKRLGYSGNEQFIAFSFHPTACEVIWNDGVSSGFGKGGWRTFMYVVVPQALRLGADLGSYTGIGSEVLLLDRRSQTAYVAPRQCAEEFLARNHGRPPPSHHCLCAMRPLPSKEGFGA
jgi:hypothetical protein